ncbi:MAG: glycosyltransferase family 4 protein [Terriglobia bacterium]
MKILLVHNSYRQPGGEDVVFKQERQLLERAGHEVVTYELSNWEIDSYSGLKRVALVRRTIWADEALRDAAKLIQRHKPEVAHVHNTFMRISPSVYRACRDASVPVVQTLHNYRLLCPAGNFFRDGQVCKECVVHSLWRSVRYGCYRDSRGATAAVALMLSVHRLLHTWTEQVDQYLALSNFAREEFVRGGLPGDRISIKPNFVYPDPGVSEGTGEHAVFVGRLSGEKGLSTMLDAWQRLRPGPPCQILGDGPLRSQLQAQGAESGLSSLVFRGHLAPDEVRSFIKTARFLILPSECYENFPMSIVEAFACGVPVICSRLGAMQEIVADGRTGLLFEPGKAEDLAEKVDWAWNHPERMVEMGKEARQEYETKYTAEKNYPLLMEIYQHAICSSKGSGVGD